MVTSARILCLIGCLIFSFNIYGQNVFRFKCFQGRILDLSKHPMDSTSWQNEKILVVINQDKDKVDIYSGIELNIDIIKYYKEYEDGDGNAEFNYEGIDQRGDKCKVELKIFKKPLSPHIATMDIKYNDVYIILRLMKDE